jgi:hypothetical protein
VGSQNPHPGEKNRFQGAWFVAGRMNEPQVRISVNPRLCIQRFGASMDDIFTVASLGANYSSEVSGVSSVV